MWNQELASQKKNTVSNQGKCTRIFSGQIDYKLWDIPELMMQANAWPMAPSLGREWHVPGPATQDGLAIGPHDDARSHASRELVSEMLAGLGKFADGGVEAMELERMLFTSLTSILTFSLTRFHRFNAFANQEMLQHSIPLPLRLIRTRIKTSNLPVLMWI